MGIYDRGYYQDDEWKGPSGAGRSTRWSMITILIVINLAIFLLDAFSNVVILGGGASEPPGRQAANQDQHRWVSFTLSLKTNAGSSQPAAQPLAGPLQKPWLVWQLLTYGFAHASISTSTGLMHIAFNLLTLFFLGRAVEQHYGSQEFIKFYLIALLVAGTVWLLAHTVRGEPGWAVGASGAVAAVVILFVLNFPKQTLLLMGVLPMPAWVLGLLLVGIDILNSFNSESHIAVEAHLAGAAFAAAYFYGKWHFRWIKLERLTQMFSGKPRLKVHAPRRSNEQLSDQADRILEKLHREGESSLTRRERKILEKYSRTVRDQREP